MAKSLNFPVFLFFSSIKEEGEINSCFAGSLGGSGEIRISKWLEICALSKVCKYGSYSALSHRALLYLQELAEELSTALPASVSCPENPKVSSQTKPKKSRQQAACRGGEEEDDTARDEDFVLQVEAEDGEESEAPSESSSDPEPAVPRSTPRGSTSGVT